MVHCLNISMYLYNPSRYFFLALFPTSNIGQGDNLWFLTQESDSPSGQDLIFWAGSQWPSTLVEKGGGTLTKQSLSSGPAYTSWCRPLHSCREGQGRVVLGILVLGIPTHLLWIMWNWMCHLISLHLNFTSKKRKLGKKIFEFPLSSNTHYSK